MICHFLPLAFISFFIQPTTYKNVVKYFDARWLTTIRRQCTCACYLSTQIERDIKIRSLHPSSCRSSWSVLTRANRKECPRRTKEFTTETSGGRFIFIRTREAQSEPTSRVRRVLKSLRSLLLSPTLPRGQRSLRHLEQSPVVFMVASSP